MARPTPKDEMVWGDRDMFNAWGGININTVHWYFNKSIFMDPTSTNATVLNQANVQAMLHIVSNKDAFEQHILQIQRPEESVFLVDQDPSDNGKLEPHQHSGIWVIRNQINRINDEGYSYVDVLGYYYVVNEGVFMAPTVGNVLNGRLQNTFKSLTESIQSTLNLPHFSAASGVTYEADTVQSRHPASSQEKTQGSKDGTPMQDNASRITAPSAAKNATNMYGPGLLAESLRLAFAFKDEFMDENPLVGEPGSFVMQKSRTDKTLVKPSQTKSVTPLPPPIETNLENPLMKGAKGGEKSPTTPGGTKKRKRSKAAVSTTTPK